MLTACGSDEDASLEGSAVLTVGEKSYSVADLESLPQTEAIFNEMAYVGVSLSDLLADAGLDLSSLQAVKVIAADGYNQNYEPDLFSRPDVIVAYALADGPMTADDGAFRMVLPGEEGRLNVRHLVEIQGVP
jgi:DMSO/TMAO reductase YedYZ molybdopterin-dependent catalytic subunit